MADGTEFEVYWSEGIMAVPFIVIPLIVCLISLGFVFGAAEAAVQGSDQAESANVKRLAALGIRTFVGHRGENIGDAAVIVISSPGSKVCP